MIKKLPIVGVMGSGKEKMPALAVPLGQRLASLTVHLLTGGGYGIMKSVAQGFTSVSERQGLSLGCIPMNATENGSYKITSPSYPNEFVELPIYVPLGIYQASNPDAITRNYVNILTSTVVIALPGGQGTKQEVELAQRFNKATMLYGPKQGYAFETCALEHTENLDEVIDWVKEKTRPFLEIS